MLFIGKHHEKKTLGKPCLTPFFTYFFSNFSIFFSYPAEATVTEEEIRKVYAEVVRGNVLSIVHRPSNRVVLQVVIYPQGDMAITHRFYMDIAKRLLKYCKEVYVDLYPQNRR